MLKLSCIGFLASTAGLAGFGEALACDCHCMAAAMSAAPATHPGHRGHSMATTPAAMSLLPIADRKSVV